jgi:hypothetical protein
MRTPRSEIPAWLELTRSPDLKDRRKALRSLCPCELKSDSAEVWERVLEMADDRDAGVRRWVIHVLCDGSPARYRDDILKLLESRYHDPDDRVRKAARRVLASYRRLGTVKVLWREPHRVLDSSPAGFAREGARGEPAARRPLLSGSRAGAEACPRRHREARSLH